MACAKLLFLTLLTPFVLEAQDADYSVMSIRTLLSTDKNAPSSVVLQGSAVTQSDSWVLYLRDATGAIPVLNLSTNQVVNGDVVRLEGTIANRSHGLPTIAAKRVRILRQGKTGEVPHVEPSQILRGEYDYQLVTTEGVLTDVFRDEADHAWCWALIEQSGVRIPINVHIDPGDLERLTALIDATVSITAIAVPDIERRTFMSYTLSTRLVKSLRTVKDPPSDPFACEVFSHSPLDQIEHIRKFAHRRRVCGRVIATWGGRHLFLRLANGRTIRVRTHDSDSLPPVGATVTAVGFLRKNAFYARLDNALVRIDEETRNGEDKIQVFDPRRTALADGTLEIDSRLNGEILRVTGIVRNLIRPGTAQARFEMACGDLIIPVETGELVPPSVGATVEVTGACVMETEIEDAATLFTRLRGFSLAPRRQEDLRVLKGPPWWTPSKFLTVIGLLLMGLGAILAWCIALKRVSDRKSRELLAEKSARLESQLRIDERTRLAVELHDSLAQNLTGISLQLDAAEMSDETNGASAKTHIANAREALRSCREGLRYCISDLRSRSFEGTSMTEAVTETVRPHIGKAHLTVRFNVPRNRFSDSSAHTVLCIVRELAVNAVRHGHATEIRIAGEDDGGCVRFSVKDNGCGFDPTDCPGSSQGHFGLMGVRERIQNFKGTLSIDSRTGQGTKVSVSLGKTDSTAGDSII